MGNTQSQLMGVVVPSTQASNSLKLIKYHIHLPYEKDIIERRAMFQYVKDRTESFVDYYFPCRSERRIGLRGLL
jgi:hypothetical protein